MYFGNGLAGSWFNLLSTHPPLLDRIKRLDPEFRGSFPEKVQPVEIDPEEAMMYSATPGGRSYRTGFSAVDSGAELSQQGHLFIHSLLAGKEFPQAIHAQDLPYARLGREVVDNFPGAVREAARSLLGAEAVLYGLLLADAEGRHAQQLEVVGRRARPEVGLELERLRGDLAEMLPECRLYLLDYAIPALKNLTAEGYKGVRGTVRELIKGDGKFSVFEYTLYHILERHLAPHFAAAKVAPPPRFHSLGEVNHDVSCLLTFLARQGNGDDSEARKAMMRAIHAFGKEMNRFDYLPPEVSSFKNFDRSLGTLAGGAEEIRISILDACLECVAYDETVTIGEAELLRVIAEVLACPVPQWLTLPGEDLDLGRES